jgi:hypothetical protein
LCNIIIPRFNYFLHYSIEKIIKRPQFFAARLAEFQSDVKLVVLIEREYAESLQSYLQ